MVPKGDRGKCLVIDYRALNKVTRKFPWPMPKVEDIFSKLNGATYFTTLDLCTGYHHIPLDRSSIPKTAFNLPFSKFEYVKVPFPTCTSTSLFPGTYDQYTQGFPFCHSVSGQTSSYLAKHCRNTFHTFAWYSRNLNQQTSQ